MPAAAGLAAWLPSEAASCASGNVTMPGSQQMLADLLEVARVTVNRALSRLRQDGLIEVNRHTITVLAPELLELRNRGGSTGRAP